MRPNYEIRSKIMRNRYLDAGYKFFDDVYAYACHMYDMNFITEDTVKPIDVLAKEREEYLEPLKIHYQKWLALCSGKDSPMMGKKGANVALSPYFFMEKGSKNYAVFNAYLDAYSAIMNYYNGRTKFQDDKSPRLEAALKNWYKLTQQQQSFVSKITELVKSKVRG